MKTVDRRGMFFALIAAALLSVHALSLAQVHPDFSGVPRCSC